MFLPIPSRLKAFTLLELVVVLVISALLFRLAYAALELVQQQQRIFERHSALLGELSRWQRALATDFRRARRVQATAEGLRCELPTGAVEYQWRDSLLLRRQGLAEDTLPAPVRVATCRWQGQPCTAGLVEEVEFVVPTARDTFYLQAATYYAAQQLLTDSLSITPSP